MTGPYTSTWYPNGSVEGKAKEFLEGLSPQCLSKVDKLRYTLGFLGPKLLKTPMMKHLEGDVFELRELCDGGALRIYIFRDGTNYYLVCGEVKKSDRANRALITYTQQCCDDHGETKQ